MCLSAEKLEFSNCLDPSLRSAAVSLQCVALNLKVKQMGFLGSLKEFDAECLCPLVSMDEGPVTEYIWLWVCLQICVWGCISQLCSVC